jgi:hypothetical protein
MTLVYDQVRAEPQLHALIIGVGGYPFLANGSTPNPNAVQQLGLLRQLGSPPISAAAIADWLTRADHPDRWRVPLGSVELLLSPPTGQPAAAGAANIEAATHAAVMQAYRRWRARCDSFEDSIAFFYFCGHGLGKVDQYLLCEDVGQDDLDLFRGGFTFESTRAAFHAVKARSQLFFVDACRSVTSGMLRFDEPDLPLERAPFATTECLHDLTVRAAAHDQKAFGPADGRPSYFAQSLIRALEGGVASKHNGEWWVKSGELGSKLQDVLGLVSPPPLDRQRCIATVGKSVALFRPPGAPKVRFSLACEPQAATAAADLSYQCLPHGAVERRGLRDPISWVVTVDPGLYEVAASFDADSPFQQASDEAFVLPPITESLLRCAQ